MKTDNLNYQNALQLSGDPFSNAPDLRFYFSFKSFEQSLRLLERLVQGGDSLILVIGEFGIGKTTLLERYLGASESGWETCRLRLNSGEAENQISQQELDDQPAYLLQDADDPILMIDDAHRLTQQQLEYLLRITRYYWKKGGRMRIIMLIYWLCLEGIRERKRLPERH